MASPDDYRARDEDDERPAPGRSWGDDGDDRPRRRDKEKSGLSGVAIALIILGVLAVVLLPCLLVVGLLVPAISKVRSAAERMSDQNNLKQLALAMHNYEATHGSLPEDAALRDKDGKALLSWRVALLPYLEQDNLFKQFNVNEPWDGPTNKPLLTMMPMTYFRPNDPPDELAQGLTHYRAFTGPQTAFSRIRPDKKPGLMDITDGTSNTIMFVETVTPIEWTKPDGLVYSPTTPLPKFGGATPNGSNVVMFDGSVRFMTNTVSEQTMRAAITARGGEVPGNDW